MEDYMRLARLTLPALRVLGLLAAPLAAEAQPAGKLYRIGWLSPSAPPPFGPLRPENPVVVFGQALSALGYVQGRDFVIESRFADTKFDRSPPLRQSWSRSRSTSS
jgi:hypothetical protein